MKQTEERSAWFETGNSDMNCKHTAELTFLPLLLDKVPINCENKELVVCSSGVRDKASK